MKSPDATSPSPLACGMCETTSLPLFFVPEERRLNDRSPRAVCRFCFTMMIGIAPRQRMRVDSSGIVTSTSPTTTSEEVPHVGP